MKGKYTQQELLLLSNFVYIPACRSDECIADIIDHYRDEDGTFTEESVLEAARGGGMSCADVATVFGEMDRRIKTNPGFGKISASRRLEEKDVRAVCYTDPKDNNPVVVFRGTGGTREAWTDNFEGAFMEDTGIQKVADDFVRYECGIYKDIVVTGHSKGGNMAQYVTIRENESILECVSYDGQGFGDDLIRNRGSDVAKASPRITSISAYNDFVNILLTCVAGTCIYVENDSSPANAHSPVTLITHNTFDDEGNFTSIRTQGMVSEGLGHLTGMMCNMLDPLSDPDKETMSMIAGTAISLALCTPKDRIAEDCIAPTLGLVTARFAAGVAQRTKLAADDTAPAAHNAYIDSASCRKASVLLDEQITKINAIVLRVNEIRANASYSITARLYADNALRAVCDDLGLVRSRVTQMAQMTRMAVGAYERAEEEACGLMDL